MAGKRHAVPRSGTLRGPPRREADLHVPRPSARAGCGAGSPRRIEGSHASSPHSTSRPINHKKIMPARSRGDGRTRVPEAWSRAPLIRKTAAKKELGKAVRTTTFSFNETSGKFFRLRRIPALRRASSISTCEFLPSPGVIRSLSRSLPADLHTLARLLLDFLSLTKMVRYYPT